MKGRLALILVIPGLLAASGCSTSGHQLMKPGRPMPGMSGMSNMKMDGMSMDDDSMSPMAVADAVTKVIGSQGTERSFFRVTANVAASGDGWASFVARPTGAGQGIFVPAAGLARMRGSTWEVTAVAPLAMRCDLLGTTELPQEDRAGLLPDCGKPAS